MQTTESLPNPLEQRFSVVGVGASAGGLDAFRLFLDGLPSTTGMAFLVVQHLEPSHTSALAEILAPRTRMKVVEGADGVEVAPNVVYVIPPNASMTLAKGRLVLQPRGEPNLPIDALFLSLAAELPGAAIGVVLSGNGADGTKGIEAIKSSGGLTFAQEPTSASNPSMPTSAIQSGAVDRALPPVEIGAAIGKISRDAFPLPPVEEAGDPEAGEFAADGSLTTLLALLHARHAVDFGSYRASALARRVRRRMTLRGSTTYDEYTKLLGVDDAELDALYDDILINVTSFFRDPTMFEALSTLVFPALLRSKGPGETIRIWVPGCSTGQEVYSILMVLNEFLDGKAPGPTVQVFATDLSERVALRKGREGAYPETIRAEVSAERLARFFTFSNSQFRVNKVLRERVVFARHDVGADPPFSHMDLVSCRNLLIYLAPALQQRVISTLHYALDPGGFLVLGAGETVGAASPLFAVLDQRSRIYTKRGTGNRHQRHFRSPVGSSDHGRVRVVPPVHNWQTEADRLAIAAYVPPGVLINGDLEVVEFRGDTAAYLAPPVGEPSSHLLRLARDGLFLELRDLVQECRRSNAPVRRDRVTVSTGEQSREVTLRVIPVTPAEAPDPRFLVLFEDNKAAAPTRTPGGLAAWFRGWFQPRPAPDPEPARLRKELAATREYLQAVVERHDAANDVLTAANEEVVSGNEELQSTNEELETAKEELQSLNEELLTVNEQLHTRNLELVRLSDDLTNLLGSAAVAMVALDNKLGIRRFTPAAAEALRLRPGDVEAAMGSLRLNVKVPDLAALCATVIEGKTLVEREVLDEAGRWHNLRIHPYRLADGSVDGVVVVLADIHDAKQAAELVRESRDDVAAIVDTVREPLLVLDEALRVTSANRAFHQRFGTDEDSTSGRRVGELGVPWLRGAIIEQLRDVLTGEGTVQDQEISSGGRTWLLNGRRMVGVRPSRVLLAIEDVTEARRLAESLRVKAVELAATDQRKNEFLAILAHELRNPLTPIRYALQIQKMDAKKAEQLGTQRMMERQVRHMTRLVDDLLDVSRISLGRIELRRSRMDLGLVVTQAVATERPLIEVSRHTLTVVVPPDPVLLDADPVRIDQIVGNLLANALKYTDPGGHIALTVRVEGAWAVLEIVDDGVGMEPELLPRIWDLFAQVGLSPQQSRGGLGIGLSLVKSLTELHGGTVEAFSEGKRRGSRFVVRLPRPTSALAQDDRHSGFETPTTTSPSRRVLLVDDDVDVAASLCQLLELMGHDVRVAHDGPKALMVAAEHRPEFVFLDIGLAGGASGLDVARQFHADPQFDATVLVALTGYGATDDRQRSLDAGFDVHLVKPAEPDDIDRVLARTAPFAPFGPHRR